MSDMWSRTPGTDGISRSPTHGGPAVMLRLRLRRSCWRERFAEKKGLSASSTARMGSSGSTTALEGAWIHLGIQKPVLSEDLYPGCVSSSSQYFTHQDLGNKSAKLISQRVMEKESYDVRSESAFAISTMSDVLFYSSSLLIVSPVALTSAALPAAS